MEVMIPVQNTPLGGIPMKQVASYEQTGWDVDGNVRSWWTVLYFNLRNILPKSGTFPLGHPVYIYYYYRYSALGPVWAETRAQSVDWYSSGMLHPGQVLRGSLPLLSPVYIYIYIYRPMLRDVQVSWCEWCHWYDMSIKQTLLSLEAICYVVSFRK